MWVTSSTTSMRIKLVLINITYKQYIHTMKWYLTLQTAQVAYIATCPRWCGLNGMTNEIKPHQQSTWQINKLTNKLSFNYMHTHNSASGRWLKHLHYHAKIYKHSQVLLYIQFPNYRCSMFSGRSFSAPPSLLFHLQWGWGPHIIIN